MSRTGTDGIRESGYMGHVFLTLAGPVFFSASQAQNPNPETLSRMFAFVMSFPTIWEFLKIGGPNMLP